MSERQEIANVAEALGTWKAAGQASIAIQRFLSTGDQINDAERAAFRSLDRLFDYASRGAEKVESRRLLLTFDSAREYTALVDVLRASLAPAAQQQEQGQEEDLASLLARVRSAAQNFAEGNRPAERDTQLLRTILRGIVDFNAQQASEYFYPATPPFAQRLRR